VGFQLGQTVNDEYILRHDLPPLEGDSIYIVGDRRLHVTEMSTTAHITNYGEWRIRIDTDGNIYAAAETTMPPNNVNLYLITTFNTN
jgi:hypothetical protein